jgi:hypothetical protein
MKKIIDGKVYNTETATFIANDYFSNCSDFYYYDESLYRTRKGSYFIAGEGGAMTKYAVSCGNNSTSGSSKIFPLTLDEALEWCENHDIDADTIAEEFSELLQEA